MIIGLTGFKRSGKDTVADFLVDKYGFYKYSFASPLKKAVCEMFGWNFHEVEKNENKEKIDERYGISYRQACQHIGTDWAQYALCDAYPLFEETTGRELWVKRFKAWYESAEIKNVVIADIRFPHEEKAIHELGGRVFRVTRPSLELVDIHESEAHISTLNVDLDIMNESTLGALYEMVDDFMRRDYLLWNDIE